MLDAVTGGDGARLYERHGWQRVGNIPDYALFPDGALCDTTVYYRRIRDPRPVADRASFPARPG